MRQFFLAVTRNLVSFLGSALTTATAVLIASLFGIEQLGYRGGPYLGIVTFVILPSLFVLGLLMIPVGMFLQRRRARRAAALGAEPPTLPVIDLNSDRTRRIVLTFLALTLVNLVILSLATYKGVEVMDSTEFCGTTCHNVMSPEYTTYQRSPHARVKCVSCHIGPGADWFVKSKLSGSWQLIAVTFNLYPRPIPTPVHSLRPARETCEQCHWPTKFVGDRLKVINRYAEDEANSERKTVMLIRVGGLQGRGSRGIHWHVDPSIRIRYRSDENRETIRDVELTRADGTVEMFTTGEAAGTGGSGESPSTAAGGNGAAAPGAEGEAAAGTGEKSAAAGASENAPAAGTGEGGTRTGSENDPAAGAAKDGSRTVAGGPPATAGEDTWRVMDCVDCHNRPSHVYRSPRDEIDAAIEQGRIDRSLPFIRREGLKALQADYPSHEQARAGIAEAVRAFYRKENPEILSAKAQLVDASVLALGDIYCTNVFPWMKVGWGTYPNHIGHESSPGCWRCHDEMHKTASGKTISQDCATCHSILANEEENPAILKDLNP